MTLDRATETALIVAGEVVQHYRTHAESWEVLCRWERCDECTTVINRLSAALLDVGRMRRGPIVDRVTPCEEGA